MQVGGSEIVQRGLTRKVYKVAWSCYARNYVERFCAQHYRSDQHRCKVAIDSKVRKRNTLLKSFDFNNGGFQYRRRDRALTAGRLEPSRLLAGVFARTTNLLKYTQASLATHAPETCVPASRIEIFGSSFCQSEWMGRPASGERKRREIYRPDQNLWELFLPQRMDGEACLPERKRREVYRFLIR